MSRKDGVLSLTLDRKPFESVYDADANTGSLAGGYFHQRDASVGRDEAYAESHAMYLRDPAVMKAQYPHLFSYWRNVYGDAP